MEGEPVENITFDVVPIAENTLGDIPIAENTLGDIPIAENTLEDVLVEDVPIIEEILNGLPPTENILNGLPPTENILNGLPPTEDVLNGLPTTENILNGLPPTEDNIPPIDPNLFVTPLVNNPNIIEQAYINQPYVKELELTKMIYNDNPPYDSLVKDLVNNFLIIENSQNEIDDVINMIRNFKIPKDNLNGMSIIDNYNKQSRNNIVLQKNKLPINTGNTNSPIFSNSVTRKNPQMKMLFS